MNDNLKKALDELYNEESAPFMIGEYVEFSPRFNREIKRMIEEKKKPAISISKHAFKGLMIAAACAALLGLGLTAGAAATQGFTKTNGYNKDLQVPTVTFAAIDDSSAPTVIEEYYKPQYPGDAEFIYTANLNQNKTCLYSRFVSTDIASEMIEELLHNRFTVMSFTQYTKADFKATFSVPKYVEVSEITVNGHPGYMLNRPRYYGDERWVIWDNGDYIMMVLCTAPAEEAMRIVESVIADENALISDEEEVRR
ncbi:MAG: DUF4367 domain-containing protein [Oscillospiraceae bacterium]|nr:DUF4367 domain-containing protein [Oscillospiraceae bacterium]